MAAQRPSAQGLAIARRAREQFVAALEECLAPLGEQIRSRLMELAQTPAGAREMQDRRDAMIDFDRKGTVFLQGAAKAWKQAIEPPTATALVRLEALSLELVDEDVVERKIMASRLAQQISDKATWELNDLKVRMQHLEGEEQQGADVLRPEALCQLLVEQWIAADLSKNEWKLVQDTIQKVLLEHAPPAYKKANEYLVSKNVLRDIDFSSRVRRAAPGRAQPHPPQQQHHEPSDASVPPADWGSHGMTTGGAHGYPDPGYTGGYGMPAGGSGTGSYAAPGSHGGQAHGAAGSGAMQQGYPSAPGHPATGYTGGHPQGGMPSGGYAPGGGGHAPAGYAPGGRDAAGGTVRGGSGAAARRFDAAQEGAGAQEETRMLTSRPPLARAKTRATGVLGQLKRLLTERVQGYDAAPPTRPSPALADAIAQESAEVEEAIRTMHGDATVRGGDAAIVVYDDAAVQRVAVDLRRRTGELKKKASTESEKAIIEIVALMFQAILSEERIPPTIRVWFARLQMPVLRVAIAEPEFFGSVEHPARQLIDRMGSVVMGFDAAAINGSALETEIKRIVQVIEQYPETGRRVFQLVYEEFQKFLSKFLTETAATQKVVSVAQQVEQKETMAIQYTIEMRKLLADMPVRDEIRDFLFKVWAEVLALAAVRHGAKGDETLALKATASDLVWAASAKPDRKERAKVIQDLPKLLTRLRQGMTLVGIVGKEQEAQIKTIGDIFADAFLSKTEAIPQDRIDAMTKRLENLEEFVSNDAEGDLPLDRESIELMLGIDASMIEVIADGGSKPSAGVLAWANELQLGNWFTLDHNGSPTPVQYVWRSDRKQLHLFAAHGGRSYLIQHKRLAAYLQAGLLLPAEEEALTVRATRDALAKLDANPERLLQ